MEYREPRDRPSLKTGLWKLVNSRGMHEHRGLGVYRLGHRLLRHRRRLGLRAREVGCGMSCLCCGSGGGMIEMWG